MGQVDSHYEQEGGEHDGEQYTIVQCPRRDCGVQAKAFGYDGARYLLSEWEHLLKEDN